MKHKHPLSLSLSLYLSIYIYIYICVCVCMCVCVCIYIYIYILIWFNIYIYICCYHSEYMSIGIFWMARLKVNYISGLNYLMCKKHFIFIPLQRNCRWNECLLIICFFSCELIFTGNSSHFLVNLCPKFIVNLEFRKIIK